MVKYLEFVSNSKSTFIPGGAQKRILIRQDFIAEEFAMRLDKRKDGSLEEAYFTFSYQPIFEGEEVTGIMAFG